MPVGDEIEVAKTTDSALTGTNLRLILRNLNIKTVICTGNFTDQCVSCTVRSLADESFAVIVLEDLWAAGLETLHHQELEIINMIYCHVMQSDDLTEIMGLVWQPSPVERPACQAGPFILYFPQGPLGQALSNKGGWWMQH